MGDMLVTIAFMVIGSSIAVFFSQEFVRSFKKLFAIPGMKIFLPLLMVTFFIHYAEHWVLLFLSILHFFLRVLSEGIAYFLPKNLTPLLNQIISIWILTLLPVWILEAKSLRQTYVSYPYNYQLASMLFLLWSGLLLL